MSAIADKLKGNWNTIKGKLKEEYGELTDNELVYQEGKEDQLLGAIQKKTGATKQELKDFIDSLQKKSGPRSDPFGLDFFTRCEHSCSSKYNYHEITRRNYQYPERPADPQF